VDYLYSLYDALVSINVPSDKARAVVDAMERDMGTTLATKQDLEVLKLATKQDLEMLRQELRQDIQLLRKEMEGRFALVDQRFDALRSDMVRDFTAQRQSIIIQLGSMMVVGFGLTIAALRLWA
jgi:ABC-type phosphate transport system auxiliary subunit